MVTPATAIHYLTRYTHHWTQCSERNDREDSARAAKGAQQVARPLSFPFPSPSATKDSPSRSTADTRPKRPENEAMELKTRRIDGRERSVVTETMEVPYDANDL